MKSILGIFFATVALSACAPGSSTTPPPPSEPLPEHVDPRSVPPPACSKNEGKVFDETQASYAGFISSWTENDLNKFAANCISLKNLIGEKSCLDGNQSDPYDRRGISYRQVSKSCEASFAVIEFRKKSAPIAEKYGPLTDLSAIQINFKDQKLIDHLTISEGTARLEIQGGKLFGRGDYPEYGLPECLIQLVAKKEDALQRNSLKLLVFSFGADLYAKNKSQNLSIKCRSPEQHTTIESSAVQVRHHDWTVEEVQKIFGDLAEVLIVDPVGDIER